MQQLSIDVQLDIQINQIVVVSFKNLIFTIIPLMDMRLSGRLHNEVVTKGTGCLTMRTGSSVLMRALGRASLDSKGVLGLTSLNSTHSSRVSFLTVP